MTSNDINRDLHMIRSERDRRSISTKDALKLFVILTITFIFAFLGVTLYRAWWSEPKAMLQYLIFFVIELLGIALYKAWKYRKEFDKENQRSNELFEQIMTVKTRDLQGDLNINVSGGNEMENQHRKAKPIGIDDKDEQHVDKKSKPNWQWNGPVSVDSPFWDKDGNLLITDPSELSEEDRAKYIKYAMTQGQFALANYLATDAKKSSTIGYKQQSQTGIIKNEETEARNSAADIYRRHYQRTNKQ